MSCREAVLLIEVAIGVSSVVVCWRSRGVQGATPSSVTICIVNCGGLRASKFSVWHLRKPLMRGNQQAGQRRIRWSVTGARLSAGSHKFQMRHKKSPFLDRITYHGTLIMCLLCDCRDPLASRLSNPCFSCCEYPSMSVFRVFAPWRSGTASCRDLCNSTTANSIIGGDGYGGKKSNI